MTETMLAAATDPPTGNRRTLVVAGGVVAALVLAGGGYVLLSGGSSDVAAGPVVTHHKPVVVKPAVVRPRTTKVTVPAVSAIPIGRDPFRALYLAPAASTVVTGTPTKPTTPTTTGGSTSTPTTPSTGGGTTPTTVTPTTYKLVLTRVYGSGKDLTGVFSVGGKTMLAKVGSVFGPTSELKLLSLSQNAKGVWTATLQVGDGEPVDAVKGQALYVR